jgi:para-nitrobenzyl esterase
VATVTAASVRSAPVVRAPAGAVRGAREGDLSVFRGIPFAKVPVGDLRFRAPEPVVPWSGERRATTFGAACAQLVLPTGGVFPDTIGPMARQEDCLTLNIWSPDLGAASLPTMVWLHGGAFTSGSAAAPMYDGGALAAEGVVVVTVNYRLHALGWLYVDDPSAGTSNAGLLDQIAALEWVRDNIAAFGGDPDNVTVFGESAGAMSTATLLAAPAARGLFRRAICQSGAGAHSISSEVARRGAERLCELLEMPAGDVAGLRRVPVDALVTAAFRVAYVEAGDLLADQDPWRRMIWAPVVDGVVLPDDVESAVAAGSARDVDLLLGANADEYNLFIWGVAEHLRPTRLEIGGYWPDAATATSAREVYAGNRPGASDEQLFAAVAGDASFWLPAIRLAEAQAAAGGAIRMYSFDWVSPVQQGQLGACHALEVPFVFGTLDCPGLLGDNPPAELSAKIRSAWARFARTGDPGGGALPHWPHYETEHRQVMQLDLSPSVQLDPRAEERRLWEHVQQKVAL